MRTRITVFAVLLALAGPAAALANQGILVLAHNGTPEWNTQVIDLAAKVDARKPVEVAFGTPAGGTIGPAVDRLANRGVTEVIAVPFFLSSPVAPEHLTGHAVPVRIGRSAAGDPVFAEIILSRANEISRNAADEVLVLMGYGSEDAGTLWAVDLAPSASQLNRARRFASILHIARPGAATAAEQQQIRSTLDRQVGSGRRILVVPAITPANGADPAIEQRLQGFSYELAKGGVMSDERLVQWLAAQTPASAR